MKKHISIIFIIIFFLVILIPLAFTSFKGGGVSKTENRVLTEFPRVIQENGSLNLRALSTLDDWINDNIGFRDFFVKKYAELMVRGFGISTSNKVLFGEDGWYFYTLDNNIEIGLGKYHLSASTLEQIAYNQQRISEYYEKQGIEYVLILTPSKASVYTEYIYKDSKAGQTVCDIVEAYLKNNTNVKVINVKNSLISSKQEGQLFWKTDRHWTTLGSYVAYTQIINEMNQYGIINAEPIHVDFSETRGRGEFNSMLGYNAILDEETIPNTSFDIHSTQNTSDEQYYKLETHQKAINNSSPAILLKNSKGNGKTLLIYGDSQWEIGRNMPLYLAENFSSVASMRVDYPNPYIDNIAKPNVVLYACSERFIDVKLVKMPDIPVVLTENEIAELEKLKESQAQVNGSLYIDNINGLPPDMQGFVKVSLSNDVITLDGWSVDFVQNTPLSGLYLKIGDSILKCNYGNERTSVSDYFRNSKFLRSGFKVKFPTTYLKDGSIETIEFIQVAGDGSLRYEPLIWTLVYEDDNQKVNIDEQNILNALPVSDAVQVGRGMWINECNGIEPQTEGILPITSDKSEINLVGWAADFIQNAPLSRLYLKVGDHIIKCPYGYERGFVADYFNNPNLLKTGFAVSFPAEWLENGLISELKFIQVASDGTYRYQDVIYSINYGPVTDTDNSASHENYMASADLTRKGLQWYYMVLVIAACIIFIVLAYFLLIRGQVRNTAQKLNQHRFLFSELVKRDFTLKYKRTILGMLWSIISPLINLLIMWLVFNNLLGSDVEHFVIYLFAGQLVFAYFNDATTLGMTSLIENAQIFSKVNVPKYMFLFSKNVSSLINFGITLVIFFLFIIFEGLPFTWNFLMLLYPITCMIIFNIGTGLILSALYVFFRDMQYLWGICTQIIMWLSAIFYSIDSYPQLGKNLFLLNPIYLFIRYIRKIVIESSVPSIWFHLLMAGYTIVIFLIGCRMYKKYNHEFLYYL